MMLRFVLSESPTWTNLHPRSMCPEEFLLLQRVSGMVRSEENTYSSTARGCLTECLLPIEMMHPDSIKGNHIETFSMTRKQRRYSRYLLFQILFIY
jgi:hypothetical protein